MSKLKILCGLISIVLTVSFAVGAQTSSFNYQGRITDAASPANGNYDINVTLFDALTGGNQLATTTFPAVVVTNGIFALNVDFGTTPFTAGGGRFIEISVKRSSDQTFATLTPRQQLLSSPFSIQASNATVANGLSAGCVGCVADSQINSISGNKIIGSVSSAANATTANTAANATTAVTAGNVSGVVAVANGGTGSSVKSFVDLTTNQTVAGTKTFSASVRVTGLTRTGVETGSSEVPAIDPGIDTYSGMVTRRVNSTTNSAGQVVARTNILRLERDGTDGGWQVSYPALGIGLEITQSVHCMAINNLGSVVIARLQLSANAAGSTPLFTNLQNIEYMQCTLGNSFNAGHQTQVTLQRAAGDFFWVGTITSTFNQ